MLRYLLSLTSLILCTSIFSQEVKFPIDSASGKIKFTEVVNVDSISKSTLYTKAREWFAKSFKSSKAVLELEDKEAGKLIAKGNFPAITEESMDENEFIKGKGIVSKKMRERKNKGEVGTISFVIAIYVKDGRYKYEIDEFYHKGTTTIVAGYSATQPDGGDLSNLTPSCGYSQWMPRIRWKNIRTNTFDTITNLIVSLKTTMLAKDKTEDF